VQIEADAAGGPGRLLVMTERNEREARGWAAFTFTGSTSLPQVTDFGPSGNSDLPPPRFAVRFDKPMDQASLQAAFQVDSDQGPVTGTVAWDAARRVATFTPDARLDPANRLYTVRLAPGAMDAWGNPLDGDLNGIHTPGQDGFEWTFGATDDSDPPQRSCANPTPDPFSPDGDGSREDSQISLDAWDNQRVDLARLEVFDPDDRPVRTQLFDLPNTGWVDNFGVPWDGRDDSRLLLPNDTYPYRLIVIDEDGNASQACTGTFEVNSVLDPAEYP